MKSPASFTGRHMALILFAFFGVVMAVNFTMARLAIGGFSGTVVDNSYVASQRYNGWLKEARAQAALGWSAEAGRAADGRIEVGATDDLGQPLAGARLVATASDPGGRNPDRLLRFDEVQPGRFRSREPLPRGRWLLKLRLSDGSGRVVLLHRPLP